MIKTPKVDDLTRNGDPVKQGNKKLRKKTCILEDGSLRNVV